MLSRLVVMIINAWNQVIVSLFKGLRNASFIKHWFLLGLFVILAMVSKNLMTYSLQSSTIVSDHVGCQITGSEISSSKVSVLISCNGIEGAVADTKFIQEIVTSQAKLSKGSIKCKIYQDQSFGGCTL